MARRGEVHSESMAWASVREWAEAILDAVHYEDDPELVKGEIVLQARSIKDLAGKMLGQVRGGVHRNPPLIVLSNPPIPYKGRVGGSESLQILDVISEEVHAILYRHVEDGKQYRHDFEHPTSMLAIKRNGKKDLLVTSEGREPVWQDF